ncbi:MAG: hypothetical protein F4W89_17210 [Acidobacteria bacterium]|nr:hypothetical protein [Acidobacteriota bacterium]
MPDAPAIGTIHKGNRPLTTLDQWRLACFDGPKRPHWRDGRSAKENARTWLEAAPDLQPDIAKVLAACRDIGPLRRWHAEPEVLIKIDTFRGPPNIDLLVVAEDDHGPIVIAIEAKADECFGEKLAGQYQHAREERIRNSRSNAVARIEALLDRFALDIKRSHVQQLRYQLFTATAAVLAEAQHRSSARAVLIVHEFVTPLTFPEKRERNAADLDRFLATVLDREGHLAPGQVAGPFFVQGAPALYVGKAQTVV